MALDALKRQKQVERKKAKDRAKKQSLAQRKTELAKNPFRHVEQAPILHCIVPDGLWTDGIGNLLISRQLSSGQVAFAAFLIDMFCLGVKDAHFGVVSQGQYEKTVYGSLIAKYSYTRQSPEYFRKLVEQSVAYARGFEIDPHADYDKAKVIFGNIDASACPQEFVFGRDGKPFFVSGPYDSPARCVYITTLLAKHVGPGGYDYLIHARGPSQPRARMIEIE